MAICVNPEFDYVLLQAPCGEVYILAKDLAKGVCKAAGHRLCRLHRAGYPEGQRV